MRQQQLLMKGLNIRRVQCEASLLVAVASLATVLLLLPAPVRAAMGGQEWLQRYNGPGNDADQAQAIAVDGEGNVIVTGYSLGSGSALDYATIKYSNVGVPLWTNRYNGPANGADVAVGLAVDGDNNVIVSGYSAGLSSSRPISVDHYATIKYSSAGVAIWTNRYVGPADYDHAAALAVDGNNDVIVTGYSSDTDFPFFRFVYATVKYSSAGVPLWVNRYSLSGIGDSANAMAVDGHNNVLVTGGSANASGTTDYVTLKYSGAGVPLWTNRYNGPGNGNDTPSAVAVDGSNDVVVTGASYSSASFTNSDYLTIKYSSSGVPLWTNRYDGLGNTNDFARALAVDRNGDVIVTGESHSGRNRDYATVQYSGGGTAIWTNRYNGPGDSDDIANAVVVDGGNNVFVTGFAWDTETHADYATIQYSSTGLPVWTNQFNGSANGNDFAYALAVNPKGNVFVTGSSSDVTLYDYATIKYSAVQPPSIAIQRVENQWVVLSWTHAAFALQGAPAVSGPFTNMTGATSPWTNSITGAQRFFRLIRN